MRNKFGKFKEDICYWILFSIIGVAVSLILVITITLIIGATVGAIMGSITSIKWLFNF